MNEQSIMAQAGARLTGLVGELTVRIAELEIRLQAALTENRQLQEKLAEASKSAVESLD